MWRQGDVLIQQVAGLPVGTRRLNRRELSRGNSSGHSHKIKNPRTARLHESSAPESSGLYLEVIDSEAQIVHPEHAVITLPLGIYRVWQQREFTDYGHRPVYD